MKLRLLKTSDLIVAAVITAIAFIFIILNSSSDRVSVEIITEGETVYEKELDKISTPFIYKTESGMEIEISGQGVRVLTSDCKGKNCISSGLLTSPGDSSICIPNKTVIRLKGSKKSGPDAITY